jgi:ATP-dependent DNA ligase
MLSAGSALAKPSARTLVLDGEVAMYDEQLRALRMAAATDPGALASPPVFMAFDLLYRDGRELTARPLRGRRARLEEVVAGSELVFPLRRLRLMARRRGSRSDRMCPQDRRFPLPRRTDFSGGR